MVNKIRMSEIESILLCPGRHRMCKYLPGPFTRDMAEEAVAHKIAEQLLATPGCPDIRPGDVVNQDGYTITIDDEMFNGINTYCKYINNLWDMESGPGIILDDWTAKQLFLRTSHILGYDITGTADYVMETRDTLYVCAFEYGKIPVEAKRNTQLMIYALAYIHELMKTLPGPDNRLTKLIENLPMRENRLENIKFTLMEKMVNFSVIQPRSSDGVFIKTYHRPLFYLVVWADEILLPRLKGTVEASAGDPKCAPGENQCRDCPAKDICPAVSGTDKKI